MAASSRFWGSPQSHNCQPQLWSSLSAIFRKADDCDETMTTTMSAISHMPRIVRKPQPSIVMKPQLYPFFPQCQVLGGSYDNNYDRDLKPLQNRNSHDTHLKFQVKF